MHASKKENSHLINENIQMCIIQINGWIVFQKGHQESLYLSALNVSCVVQVIYAECNCKYTQNK